MADLTRHDMQLIDEHDQHRDTLTREQLERLGVQLRVAHFTGDSSYPTEYTLRYSFVSAVGPTLDLAIAAFVEALLRYVPVEKEEQSTSYLKGQFVPPGVRDHDELRRREEEEH